MVTWDGVAAAVTGRRSWLLGLGVILLGIGFMVLIGGIPSGGGVIVHADTTIEPLRRPAHEFRFEGTRVVHSLLCAAEGD
jgi:hypothetical protein